MSSAGLGGGQRRAAGGDTFAFAKTPSLPRRMACFVYEATLLFGLGLIPGALGALFFAQTGQHHPLQSAAALRLYALVFYAIYFVWIWAARGQTLAMQTWHIRVTTIAGAPLSQWRALARFGAACACWFGPASLLAWTARLAPWPALATVACGISAYALLTLAEPTRQFWHDRLCGTQLVDARAPSASQNAIPRRR